MLRRLPTSSGVSRRLAAAAARPTSGSSGALCASRRHLEPMSVWYLASWTCVWWYAFFFWMPVLWTDLIVPSFVYNKLPLIHFIQEKRGEQRLRRELDSTFTQWHSDLDASHITDAISRTF